MDRIIEYGSSGATGKVFREDRGGSLTELMRQSESGRELLRREELERNRNDPGKRQERGKNGTETGDNLDPNGTNPGNISETRTSGKGSTLSDAIGLLVSGKELPTDIRAFDKAANGMLVDSGISTGYGIHLPLETRGILSKDAPIASFIAKYDKAIRDRLVLSRLGATFINARGRSVIPAYTGSTSSWEGETEAADEGKGTFLKMELTPKRITTKLTISRMLLAQNGDIDDLLVADLSESVASTLEAAVFGDHESTDGMPDGFFTGETITPVEASHAAILALEKSVRNNGAPMAFCMTGEAERILKSTSRGQGSIIYNGSCDDYPYTSTDLIPGDMGTDKDGQGIIFGRWSDLVIARWGAMEILYNPYTQAINGEVELIVNSYYDFAWREGSFSLGAIG